MQGRFFAPRFIASVIVFLIVALALLNWITPPHAEVLHNILHHLNILPFMLAGMIFGWKGALRAIVFATLLLTPAIYRHWSRAPLDAQDQIVELSTFGAAGVIAGLIADRERTQRQRAENARQQLEQVYSELHANIQQMKKTERLTAAGHLAASLAHEIRNPLASISGAAGILARGNAPAESQHECLDILMKESQRLNKLLTNFLDFARPRLPRFRSVDPLAVLQSVIVLAQHAASARGIPILLNSTLRQGELECDAEQIKQVLLNLILNALQATIGDAAVMVNAAMDERGLLVDVKDEGSGVAEEDLDRLFDPFFTTKENGTGLGLAVSANIVAQHGGMLSCARNQGSDAGMTFRMVLPRNRPAVHSPVSLREKAVTA